MDRIPITILNLLHIVKLLLHQKARIESWLGSVREVNAWDSVVVVELDILFKNVIALLLKSKQVWRREESSVACRIELVCPRGSVRVTISVVLVLKVFAPSLFILSDLYITFLWVNYSYLEAGQQTQRSAAWALHRQSVVLRPQVSWWFGRAAGVSWGWIRS